MPGDEGDGARESTDRTEARDRPARPHDPAVERDVYSTGFSALFVCSDGSHYTDWQLERRLECGTWRRCLSQQEPERHVLEDERGRLLLLERIDIDRAPPWLEVRVDVERAWTVDTRAVVGTPTVQAHSSRDVTDRR